LEVDYNSANLLVSDGQMEKYRKAGKSNKKYVELS
jgi:hypothetical protein